MKVLMINGSPRTNGNTYVALQEMEKVFAGEGIEVEILQGQSGHPWLYRLRILCQNREMCV